MYCKVIYYNDSAKGYTGRSYTYSSGLDLKVGDKVLCPVGASQEMKRAMIVETDVPDSEIDPVWADRIKEIMDYDYCEVKPSLMPIPQRGETNEH